ncbi:DUF2892 domain-containing protein [bacterium]|nr:DUF2892 domain-containing protein [bacterium]
MIKVTRNESELDRLLRLIAGVSLIFLALLNTSLDSVFRILFLVFAGALIFTSLTGFCGIYRLLGITTCPIKPRSSKKRSK